MQYTHNLKIVVMKENENGRFNDTMEVIKLNSREDINEIVYKVLSKDSSLCKIEVTGLSSLSVTDAVIEIMSSCSEEPIVVGVGDYLFITTESIYNPVIGKTQTICSYSVLTEKQFNAVKYIVIEDYEKSISVSQSDECSVYEPSNYIYVQRLLQNPNDFRLFMYMDSEYRSRMFTGGYKVAVSLDTNATMSICQFSDKTFRKSRNSLMEKGFIKEISTNMFRIDYAAINAQINNLKKELSC